MASRAGRAIVLVVAAMLMVTGLPRSARAVSLHDLIALSQAGLSDSVLIALIQTDQTIYGVDAAQVLALKKAGVSDPVIVALLRNGRRPAAPAVSSPQPAAAPATPASSSSSSAAPAFAGGATGGTSSLPGLVIIGDHSNQPAPPTSVTEVVVVPSPVVYPGGPVTIIGRGRGGRSQGRGFSSPGFGQLVPGTFPPTTGFRTGALSDGFVGAGCVNGRPVRGIRIGGTFVDGLRIQNPAIVGVRVRGQSTGHW